MQRYLVRRATSQVFVWTDMLSKRADLEEVHAENPADALQQKPVPTLDGVSMDAIEAMTKRELIFFARLRLGLELVETMKVSEMQDSVKERLIMRPTEEQMAIAVSAGPFATAQDARARSGMVSPGTKKTPFTGDANARADANQPVQ